MATFAVIGGDRVINTIVADTLEDAQLVTNAICVEYTAENPTGIGEIYDAETGTFSSAVEETTPVVEEGVTPSA
jgi:hypothetical protein